MNEYVYLFNTTNYQGTYMWKYMAGSPINHVAISDDGNYAVVSNIDDEVFFFNTTDYDQLAGSPYGIPMWSRDLGANQVYDLAISSNGKNIAIAETNNFYYFNNSFSGGQKVPMWSFAPPSREGDSVGITADGEYVLAGESTTHSAFLFNNSITNPKNYEWKTPSVGNYDIYDVAISGWGDYFAVGKSNEEIVLFHHARPWPIILGDDDDDDDDDEEEAAIPFGNYYLVFSVIAIVSLIFIIKRKTTVIKN